MSPQKHKKVVQFKQSNNDDDEEREEVDHEHVVDINPHHHGGHHRHATNAHHSPLESEVTADVASLSISDANDAAKTVTGGEKDNNNNNNNNNNDNSKNNDEDDEQLIWFKEEENWELTWPIWHMLPRQERKDMALKYGYKTIGAFEEYMSLKSAVGDSELATQEQYQKPYENQSIHNHNNNSSDIRQQQQQQQQQQMHGGDGQYDDDQKVHSKEKTDDSDDDEDEEEDEEENQNSSSSTLSSDGIQVKEQGKYDNRRDENNELSYEELLQDAGLILMLPDELLHSIFEWLPIDVYGTLALLNSHWKSLTQTEFVYKRLCERIYLQQSKRKALHVSRFGNSYRTMLEQRPRVRTGGGVYVLKYAQVKKIQRDMWTEIPVGAVLETVYYRYFYFQEDGRVLYALTSRPPHEMFPRFWKMVIHTDNEDQHDKAAVWGTYQVQKNTVTVNATHPWHSVRMVMTIQSQSIFGKFNALSFDKHWSSASANFDEYWSQDLVEYKVPHEQFQFVKDKRL